MQQVTRMETWNIGFSGGGKKTLTFGLAPFLFSPFKKQTEKKLPVISARKLTFQIALLPEDDDHLIYCLLAWFKSVKNIKHKF